MTESMSKCTFTERSGETFEDYTAVTDWEVFTQELENLLISWIIKEDIVSSTDCGRLYLCGNLKFGQRVFSLFYYKYKESGDEDKKSTNSAQPNDTQTSAHLITRIPDFNQPYLLPLFWFGLSHAFLLKPEVDWIKGGTRLSLLLSSVEMAVYSTRCPIPLLVEHYIQTYFGLVASSSLKSSNYAQNSEVNDNRINSLSSSSWIGSLNIDFSSCHFTDEISQNCTHLGGLKEIFLTKLGYPWSVNCAVPKLDIAARFIYHLPSCSSLQTDYSNTNLSIFSFDLFQESPLELSFNLATTWPSVPSHAITEKPSWKSLKPEGAPEWQLQMCSTSPFVDRMSKRIQRLLEPDHILSDKSSQPTDFSSDADSEGLCNKVLRSELTSPFTNPTSHELLFWNRKQLSYSDVKKLAAHFGLPNPCCLIHRLAVVIGNLFVYKNCDRSQLIPLIKSMFNELHIELKLRYDRLICLPSLSLYEEVYRNVSHSSETISSFLDDDGNDRPNLMPWNQSSMMSASELKFNDWPNDAFHSLDYVFNRFNACILKAREGEQSTTSKNNKIPSSNVSSNDEDEDGEAFFDAYDESHSSYHENSLQHSQWLDTYSRKDALCEAEAILNWFKSRRLRFHLRSLLPNIILECLLTFHSLVPHPQLSDWYSSSLRKLDQKVYDLLSSIRSMKSVSSEETTSNNNKCNFPYSVFSDVLALISRFSTEITCLNELISNAIICGHGDSLSSNSFLDALCHLSSNVNLKEKGDCTSEPYIFGSWIDLPLTKFSTNMILAFLKTLFEKCVPTELADSELGKFNFTSVPQTWIPPNRPVDLRRPDMEMYIFYTELGYPNPLVSRLGPQRLFIELAYDKKTSSYTHLKMAGSFSQDTQFF